MATTYEAIATVTVGSGGAANINFTSIPATYTDLAVLLCGRTDRAAIADSVAIRFNDSTTSYTQRTLTGDGSSAGSASETNIDARQSGDTATASTFGSATYYIPNYAGSTNKSVSVDSVQENNATEAYMRLSAGLWSNTAAITKITLVSINAANFKQYTTATLYGIKNS
jgi:hypothetical protein